MTGTLEHPAAADVDRMRIQSRVDALKAEISNIQRAKARNDVALSQRRQALSRLEGQLALCGPARVPSHRE